MTNISQLMKRPKLCKKNGRSTKSWRGRAEGNSGGGAVKVVMDSELAWKCKNWPKSSR